MPCFRPVSAYRFFGDDASFVHASGKRRLFFGKVAQKLLPRYGSSHELVVLPCGKCLGCLLRRVSDWSLRCVYEAANWERSSFLTLTYRSSELPANRSLLKSDHQRFFKRLRQRLAREHSCTTVKYFMCGEYGERKGRPHYHVVLFGWDFPDRIPVPNNPGSRDPLFTSPFLEEVWGHGDVRIGDVTSESAAYVARYSLKKLRGKSGKYYESAGQVPPYIACSKGIAKRHFERFRRDHYPSDEAVCLTTCQKRPNPRYFDKLLERVDSEALAAVKEARIGASVDLNQADLTPQRLRDREEVLRRKLGVLFRDMERNHAAEDSGRCA